MRASKGYTLVELFTVLVIIGILASIAVPVYSYFMDEYKEDFCEVNRVEMARLYREFLDIHQVDHSEAAFVEFTHTGMDGDVCSVGGEISYVDGNVECSLQDDEGSFDGPPFL